ncbi:hypothetical protein Tsubulata_003473, partial [Turnera subulata]
MHRVFNFCRVGLELPTVEKQNVRSSMESHSQLYGLQSKVSRFRHRMTLLLGPPGCGKTTLLQALAGKLPQSLKVTGEVTYNGYKFDEFVPQKTSAYVSQHDRHISEMTVRETLDFSACCQGIGARADIMKEIVKREEEAGIVPDPDVDTYMKGISIEGLRKSLQRDYKMKVRNFGCTKEKANNSSREITGHLIHGKMKLREDMTKMAQDKEFPDADRENAVTETEKTRRKTRGIIKGGIRMGGYPKVQENYARISGYCEQNDIHSPQITVEESLIYSAWLRLPAQIDATKRSAFVAEVLEMIELDEIKDELVGIPGVSGISTAQHKRLTIAVELVSNPSIIFMDEPTSCLDARAAAIVMPVVKNIVNTGRTVVCTIHQPSIHIFEAFDELILLKRGGQIIYSGELGQQSSMLIEYFEASFRISNTLSSSSKNEELVRELSHPAEGATELHFSSRFARKGWEQYKACLWKQHLAYWRNSKYNLARVMYITMSSLIFGPLNDLSYSVKGDNRNPIYTPSSNFVSDNYISGYRILLVNLQIILVPVLDILHISLLQLLWDAACFVDSNFPSGFSICQSLLHNAYLVLRICYSGPQIPKWWVWAYWMCPIASSLKGILIPQYGDIKQEITVYGDTTRINDFLRSYFGYEYNDLSIVAVVLLAFPVVFVIIFAFAVEKLNFQKSYFGYEYNDLSIVAVVLLAFPVVFVIIFAFAVEKLNFQKSHGHHAISDGEALQENGGGDMEDRLQWAAVERLPTVRRVRLSLFEDNNDKKGNSTVVDQEAAARKRVVDVTKLGAQERHVFIERLITKIEEDNRRLLTKLKERIDRYQNMSVEAECELVHGTPLPTFWNTLKNSIRVVSEKDQAQYWNNHELQYSFVSEDKFVDLFQKFHIGHKLAEELSRPSTKAETDKNALSFDVYPSGWKLFKACMDREWLLMKRNSFVHISKTSQVPGEREIITVTSISKHFKLTLILLMTTQVSSSNVTIGQQLLKGRGLYYSDYFYWVSVAALLGMWMILNVGFTLALGYLEGKIHFITAYIWHAPGRSMAIISQKKLANLKRGEDLSTEFVAEVLKMIELDDIKDALVGVPGVSGISSEQRKRLTIAVELVSNPAVIFMDEPTTGLDARAAAIVMRVVKNIVKTNRTIVCTIHQPSIDVFEAFDELILLKRGGQVIYSGELGLHSSKLIEYFESIPRVPKIKENYNPATWMLDVTSPSSEAQLGLEENEELVKRIRIPPEGSKEIQFPTRFPQNGWQQFKACLWKQSLAYWRSPNYNLARLAFVTASSLIFGVLLWQKGQKIEDEEDLLDVLGPVFIVIQFTGMVNCSSVLPFVASERIVVYRERNSILIPSSSTVLGNYISRNELILVVLQSIL